MYTYVLNLKLTLNKYLTSILRCAEPQATLRELLKLNKDVLNLKYSSEWCWTSVKRCAEPQFKQCTKQYSDVLNLKLTKEVVISSVVPNLFISKYWTYVHWCAKPLIDFK